MKSSQTVTLMATVLCLGVAHPRSASAQVNVSIAIGTPPPPLPVYVQPPVPAPDYIWTPGYWAWGPAGYFWVPGTWVLAPEPGLLWTPGYWGWDDDQDEYVWHPGYWGPAVGYYGGINYGFGYFGRDYVGADWYDGHVRYNTAVTQVNRTIVHNVYVNKTVIVNNTVVNNHVSYNGGHGGVIARPTSRELTVMRRVPMTTVQQQHVSIAERDRNQLVSVNHGRPAYVAAPHPLASNRPPSNFAPIHSTDRVAVQKHPVTRPSFTAAPHGAPLKPARVTPDRPVPPKPAQPQHGILRTPAPPRPMPSRPVSADRSVPSRPAPARPVQSRPVPQKGIPPRGASPKSGPKVGPKNRPASRGDNDHS